MATTNPINTPKKREKLSIRNEPYWYSIGGGRSLGYRKTKAGGAWIMKLGRSQKKVGSELDYTYEEALEIVIKGELETPVKKDKTKFTLAEVIERYLEKREADNGAASAKTARTRFKKVLPQELLDTPALSITKQDFHDWLFSRVYKPGEDDDELIADEKIRKSKSTANRDFNDLKSALNYVYDKSQKGVWGDVPRFKNADSARILFLSEAEIQTWLLNASDEFHDLSKAAILTGCRLGELKYLTVGQLEELRAAHGQYILDIRKSKTGPRIQHLSSEAAEFLLYVARDKKKSDLLLPNPDGKMWKRNEHTTPVKNLRDSTDLPEDAVFYSLRHYYISRALIAGFNVIALARNVGTSVEMLEKYYAKFMDQDLFNMLNNVEV